MTGDGTCARCEAGKHGQILEDNGVRSCLCCGQIIDTADTGSATTEGTK